MGNTNVLLDGKAQEIMKDVYHLAGGGSGGIEYVEINSTQGTITQDQATKLQNGAYVKIENAVLIPMENYSYYRLVILKGAINMQIITFDISNLTYDYLLYSIKGI